MICIWPTWSHLAHFQGQNGLNVSPCWYNDCSSQVAKDGFRVWSFVRNTPWNNRFYRNKNNLIPYIYPYSFYISLYQNLEFFISYTFTFPNMGRVGQINLPLSPIITPTCMKKMRCYLYKKIKAHSRRFCWAKVNSQICFDSRLSIFWLRMVLEKSSIK